MSVTIFMKKLKNSSTKHCSNGPTKDATTPPGLVSLVQPFMVNLGNNLGTDPLSEDLIWMPDVMFVAQPSPHPPSSWSFSLLLYSCSRNYTCQWRDDIPGTWRYIAWGATFLNLNFHPLEIVSRYRDPQLQVGENDLFCTIWIKIGLHADLANSMLMIPLSF